MDDLDAEMARARVALAEDLARRLPRGRVAEPGRLVAADGGLRVRLLESPAPPPRGDAHDASAWRRFGWDSAFRVEVDGVQWDLCGGLDALVPTLVATHALVGRRGLLGLRPRRRWWPGRRSLLADLELIAPCYREGEPWSAGARPPLRASPIVGRCFLVGRWVMLADLDAAWVRPYEVGSAVTPLMRLRPRHIPAATALFAELCGLARRPALPSAVAYRDDQHDGVLY